MTYISKMYSYLMSPAGFKFNLNQRIFFTRFYCFIMSNCSLTVLPYCSFYYRIFFSCNGNINNSLTVNIAGNNGIINFFHAVLQCRCCKSIFGYYTKSGGIPVKAVYRTKCNIRIFCRKKISQSISLMFY